MEHSSTSNTVQSAAAYSSEEADTQKPESASVSLAGSVIAGLAASACCLGPLVFVALGLGGAAAGLVEFFTPLRPLFIGLALLFPRLRRVPAVLCAQDLRAGNVLC